MTEVDSNNQIVFQLEYDNGGNLYRAQKFDWFFYSPPIPTWDCVGGVCVDPGTGQGLYSTQAAWSAACVINITEEYIRKKEILLASNPLI